MGEIQEPNTIRSKHSILFLYEQHIILLVLNRIISHYIRKTTLSGA